MCNLSRIWICLSIVAFLGLMESQAKEILAFFPHPFMSHQHIYRPVIQALAKRGHNITYVSGFRWAYKHPNIKHKMIDFSFMSEFQNKLFYFSPEAIQERTSPLNIFSSNLNQASMEISKRIVKDRVVQNLIRSEKKFDLVMAELLMGYEHFAAFKHKFNATGITFMSSGFSAWANEIIGFPDNPSYMVDLKSPYNDKMSRLERFHNAIITYMSLFHGYKYLDQSQALADSFFRYPGWEKRPSINELAADQALILVNAHHSVGHTYPKASHVKEIGGVGIPRINEMSTNISSFMNSATDGVIYFSLGSYVDFSSSSMTRIRDVFLKVLSGRKEKIVWKWSGHGLGKQRPENIMFLQWTPQQDILGTLGISTTNK